MSKTPPKSRRSGRQHRLAQRAAPPKVNPAPAGQIGGQYRPSTLKDLHDFTRLQDTLDSVAWFTRCCIATDLPDNFDLDVNTAYALMRNTTKPVATAFTIAEHVDPIVKMLDIAAGCEGEFAKLPFLKIS